MIVLGRDQNILPVAECHDVLEQVDQDLLKTLFVAFELIW